MDARATSRTDVAVNLGSKALSVGDRLAFERTPIEAIIAPRIDPLASPADAGIKLDQTHTHGLRRQWLQRSCRTARCALQAGTHHAGIFIHVYFRASLTFFLRWALHGNCVGRTYFGAVTTAVA